MTKSLLTGWVVLALLLASLIPPTGGQTTTSCDPPEGGDWLIDYDQTVVCEGITAEIHSFTVRAGATLTIRNSEIIFVAERDADPEDTDSFFSVTGTSFPSEWEAKLVVEDSTFRAKNPTKRPIGSTGSTSTFHFIRSEMIDFYGVGIGSAAKNALIKDSKFTNVWQGLVFFTSNAVVDGNFFTGSHDTLAMDGSPVITNNIITNCAFAIFTYTNQAKPTIEDNTITNCASGMTWANGRGSPTVRNNDFLDNENKDFYPECPECPRVDVAYGGNFENNFWGEEPPNPDNINPSTTDYTPWLTAPAHPERLPAPVITGPSQVARGASASYSASDSQPSTEFGFPVTRYEWTLPDGSTSTTSSLSWTAPDEPGTYPLQLRVWDEYHLTHYTILEVEVQNAAPRVESATIDPTAPKAGDNLMVDATGADDDQDDVSFTYQWKRNGATQSSLTESTVPGSHVEHGDEWSVTITPTDGHDEGDPVTRTVSVADNTAPTITTASIAPADPSAGEALTATATTTDDDGDPVTLSYAWKRNTVAQNSLTGSTVPGNQVKPGDSWSVTITPHDGYANGDAVTRTVTVAANNAPTLTTPTIAPTAPEKGDTLTASATATDPDGDSVTRTYKWERDGTLTTNTGATLPGANVQPRQSWRVQVTATDEYGATATAWSEPVIVQNRAPVDAAVTLTAAPTKTTGLRASATASDLDGDAVTWTYSWTRNGDATTVTTATVPSAQLVRGDVWSVVATPTDGHDAGTAATASTTIQNAAPTLTSSTHSPLAPKVGQAASFQAQAGDADGDALTVTWSLPGGDVETPIAEAATHTFTTAGQHTVAFTVSDGNGGAVQGQRVMTIQAADSSADQGGNNQGSQDTNTGGNQNTGGQDTNTGGNQDTGPGNQGSSQSTGGEATNQGGPEAEAQAEQDGSAGETGSSGNGSPTDMPASKGASDTTGSDESGPAANLYPRISKNSDAKADTNDAPPASLALALLALVALATFLRRRI